MTLPPCLSSFVSFSLSVFVLQPLPLLGLSPWGSVCAVRVCAGCVCARVGVRHCSLCDITHSLFAEKSKWKECRDGLGVDFVTFHRNDQPDDVRQCINGRYPAVVARSEAGEVAMFMNAEQIAACGASPQQFAAEITRWLVLLGLRSYRSIRLSNQLGTTRRKRGTTV